MSLLPATLRVLLPAPSAAVGTAAGGRVTALLRGGAHRVLGHSGVLRYLARTSSTGPSTLARLVKGVRTVFGWHRPLVGFAGLMGVEGAAVGVASLLDRRQLDGASVWFKPLKFAISLATYAVTLAWMLSMVTKPSLRRIGWWAGAFGTVACTVEMATITVQAVRGRRSHFNVSTPLDSRLYLAMGLALPAFYGVTLVIGGLLTVFSRPVGDRSLVWALRSGLTIGVSGLSVGFAMGRPTSDQRAEHDPDTMGSHSVGGDDPSGGLPFLGWNTEHGDLRVPHFIGMHALQGLPLLALALRGLAGDTISEDTRVRIVLTSAATWAALAGTALQQALRGRPVTHLDGVTSALLAGTGASASLAAVAIRQLGRRVGEPTRPASVALRSA